MTTVNYIVIHHTADKPEITMEEERASQVASGRFKEIAYNGYIEQDGTFKKGRSWDNPNYDQNAANEGLNHESVSCALAGNFQLYKPTEAQFKTLVQVVATWAKRWNVPTNRIIGHYQVSQIKKDPSLGTLCPGKYLIDLLPELRKQVQKYLEPKS